MNSPYETPPVQPRVNHLTFRSSRIIYYGPHACSNCGILICRMGHEFGGNGFTYPEGPIYPNTEWHPHVCDPKRVAAQPKPIESAPPDNDQPPAGFNGPTCRGSYILGSACGGCERCKWERNNYPGNLKRG